MLTHPGTHDARLSATPPLAEAAGLRLAPIDTYRGFWLALLRSAYRRLFGKVMMPLRVLFPRIPGYAFAHLCLISFMGLGLRLPRQLTHMLSIRISRNNGCSFCCDAHQAAFVLDKADPGALHAALLALDDPTLDPRTRAVLAYADEVVDHGNVSDATFAALMTHFDERQVAEVVWLAAFVTYTNMLARPLGIGSDGLCALAQVRLHRRKPA